MYSERLSKKNNHRLPIRRRSDRSAFSLVELMVVIIIIGLLAGAVTISVRSYMGAARRNTAKMDISKIVQAIDLYYDTELKGYPTKAQGLEILTKPTDRFDGYLKKTDFLDPWDHPYDYIMPGPNNLAFEIISYGSDGKEGGVGDAQDISSANLKK